VLFMPATMATLEDVADGLTSPGGPAGGGAKPFGMLNGRAKGKPSTSTPSATEGADKTPRERAGESVEKRYSSVDELPATVRDKLSDRKARQWMHVWNSAFDEHGDEKRAFASAWSTVQKTNGEVVELGSVPFSAKPHRILPKHFELVDLGRPLVRKATDSLANDLKEKFREIAEAIRVNLEVALLALNKREAPAMGLGTEPGPVPGRSIIIVGDHDEDEKLPHDDHAVERIIESLGLLGLLIGLSPRVRLALMLVAGRTVQDVAGRIGASDEETAAALADAEAWAGMRAAELVGAVPNLAGDLVRDQRAERSILGSTKRMLSSLVRGNGASAGSVSSLADALDAGLAEVFSDQRAERIAQFEIDSASNYGVQAAISAVSDTQPLLRKFWFSLIDCCPVCEANTAAGAISAKEDFPSGDHAPPNHPNCRCSLGWSDESGE